MTKDDAIKGMDAAREIINNGTDISGTAVIMMVDGKAHAVIGPNSGYDLICALDWARLRLLFPNLGTQVSDAKSDVKS